VKRSALLALAFAAIAAHAEAPAITVGAVVPQSGDEAGLATGFRQALLLWQQQANAAGGLLGRRIVLRLLDDQSEAIRDGALYRELIERDKADLLIGPFGSAATLMAAQAAEDERRVMINATGTFAQLAKVAYRYVFQVPAPVASYGAGALAIARKAGFRRLFLVARDEPAARQAAEATRADAAALGLEAGEVTVVPGKITDYAQEIGAARARRAEAWIEFGHARDAANLVISFQKSGYAPKMLLAQGAAEPRFIELVGQAAEYSMGIVPYADWLPSLGNGAFASAYEQKWHAKPDLAAAEGYAACEVLVAAVRRADTLDQEALRQALAALEMETVLGPYKVNRNGNQIGLEPAVVQIIKGKHVIVWPARWASAPWQLPYPPWSQRKLLGPPK
jgi:branched-chain amino acid transport system substrate-binding protein